jgi:hypothetical protein
MGIDVRGGAGGTAVGLDELESAARVLGHVSEECLEVLAAVGLELAASGWTATQALSPATAVRGDLALADAVGSRGLLGDAVELRALADATCLAVAAYREAERRVAAAVDVAEDGIAVVVGHSAVGIGVGVLVLEALGVDVAAGLDRAVFESPGVADLAGHTAGLSAGALANPVLSPLLWWGVLSRRPGERGLDGGVGPDEAGLRVIADSAEPFGLLVDAGAAQVHREQAPRDGASAPCDLASLARDLRNLSSAEHYPGRVRVVQVPQEQGSAWVVEVSGTQFWEPRAGPELHDVTTDVRLMAQESTLLASAVQDALDQAQAEAGADRSADPVLLTGHSLGGMVAAGLAASPGFRARHGPVAVVALGSPVSRMPVPSTGPVLALDHVQDAVPRLDGTGNPDRASWVTVQRDLRDDTDRPATTTAAHDLREYAETAAEADRSRHPSLVHWREQHRGFFEPAGGREPVIRDYRVERASPAG